jgi:hypothetical protein
VNEHDGTHTPRTALKPSGHSSGFTHTPLCDAQGIGQIPFSCKRGKGMWEEVRGIEVRGIEVKRETEKKKKKKKTK